MKTKIITIIVLIGLLLLAEYVQAQKVYVTKNKQEANMVIYLTRYLNEADLVVYKTNYIVEAESIGKWFFVDSKHKADWIIYYTKYITEADLNIMWTTYPTMAGYQPNRRETKSINK